MEYTASELMTVNSARMLRDGDTVFVGWGCPTWPATWPAAHMPPTC
jgi:acyl CoA:acetate/3-ketoacid CoA transferase beta subunit